MRCIHVVTFLIALAISPIATAQTPSVEELQKAVQTAQTDAAALREAATKLKAQNDDLRKRVEGKESALWERYYKAKESEYDFQIEMMNVNARSFFHQTIASYVILALVVLVVGGGLYFAQIQLMAGLQPITTMTTAGQTADIGTTPTDGAEPVAPPATAATGPIGTTTLAAEVGKVTVTSSVVGVIVLVISLAFLYIYTREIYHIQVIDPFRPAFSDPSQADAAKGAAPAKK